MTDPGEHRPTSFSVLASGPGRRQRGVEIQLASGERVRVRVGDVTIVAPDHPLRPEPSAAHADWWLEQLEPWPAVAGLVPRSLAAVARVLHPYVGPEGRRVRWSEAVQRSGLADERALAAATVDAMFDQGPEPDIGDLHVPDNGHLDPRTAQSLVGVLADHTAIPDDVFVAVWEGWGDTPRERWPGAALVTAPMRGHLLLRGPLRGVLSDVSISLGPGRPASGVWWPRDHSWLVHTEIDFAWTYVAGDSALVDDLRRHDHLEVQVTHHDAPMTPVAPGTGRW